MAEPPQDWDIDTEPDGTVVLSRASRFSREEWRIGQDLLIVHSTLFGLGRPARYTGARLEIDRSGGGGGGSSEARLSVVLEAKKRVLATDPYEDTIRALGLFVSEKTGWPLRTVP